MSLSNLALVIREVEEDNFFQVRFLNSKQLNKTFKEFIYQFLLTEK
jgi:hypothetical protein